eukprot:504112_1
MSQEVIELQYTDVDSPDDHAFNKEGANAKSSRNKPNPKNQKSYTYEHVEQEDEEELKYTDIDIATPKSTVTQNIQAAKLKQKLLYDAPGRALLSWYLIGAVAILGFMIAAFIRQQEMFTDTMMAFILLLSFITIVCSVIALCGYGRLQDQVDRLKLENSIYDRERIKFTHTNKVLKGEIDDFEKDNEKLRHTVKDLDGQTDEFSGLVDDLEELAEDGEKILDCLDRFNGTFDRMNDWIYQTEKARLLCAFYECAFRDQENDMNRKEYERFLTMISKDFREKFKNLGEFEDISEDKEGIDVTRFLEIVDAVLNQSDDVMQREFIKTITVAPTWR